MQAQIPTKPVYTHTAFHFHKQVPQRVLIFVDLFKMAYLPSNYVSYLRLIWDDYYVPYYCIYERKKCPEPYKSKVFHIKRVFPCSPL